jgi:hypothetical protein
MVSQNGSRGLRFSPIEDGGDVWLVAGRTRMTLNQAAQRILATVFQLA